MSHRFSFIAALCFCVAFATQSASASDSVSPTLYGGLKWRMAGPFRGGRVLAVSGVPENPNLFYFGAVGGGVWKSDDAGETWTPIFDSQPVASIGALAVAPSNPDTIYVGSGEADMRSDIIHGNGMYKSNDAGVTWKRIGLENTRQISRIIVDPRDAGHLYVAALGHAYGPNEQRGVFESRDGGASWQKILYRDADTGAVDLAMDSQDSRVLLASLWQTRRPPWNIYPPSSGPGSGLYRSSDAGKTWSRITAGLPSGRLGKIGIAFAPGDGRRAYAVVDSPDAGGLYRSDDRGNSWTLRDNERRIWQLGWYFSHVAVDPQNENTVYVSDTALYRSNDGGRSFDAIKGAPGGDDYHMLWIDPANGARMILASDQGAIITLNRGRSWSSWYNQPTAQFYHVATDNRFPYWIYGAQQDSGAVATPSRSSHLGISMRDWKPITAGGESGYIAPDPQDPQSIYGTNVEHENLSTEQDQDLSVELAHPAIYRHAWTLPLVISPSDNALYYSTNVLFRSRNRGRSWQIVSRDLTRADPGVPQNLDNPGASDRHGGRRQGVIYTIAPSPLSAVTIWAGTDDGKIWLSTDDARTWRDVTPPQLGPWSKVGIIEASHGNVQTAYAAVDRHRLEDDRPYIYRTQDSGKTWTLITSGLPMANFVNAVREDPITPGLLFAGTESGVYVSFDAGTAWSSLIQNMPVVSVRDLSIRQNDLVIATHGRSFWVLDDIAALRDLRLKADPTDQLFSTAQTVRMKSADDEGTPLPKGFAQANNPPTGAVFDYYLNRPAVVSLEISDAHDNVVRRFSSTEKPEAINPKALSITPDWPAPPQVLSGDPGMHRFVWNLRTQGAAGMGRGPLALPGRYRVQLRAGQTTMSHLFMVREDPRVRAGIGALQQQYTLSESLDRARARADDAVAEATRMRAALMKKRPRSPVLAQLDAVAGVPAPQDPDDSIGAPQTNLHSLLYLQNALEGLFAGVQSADAAPTAGQISAAHIYTTELDAAIARWQTVRAQAQRALTSP